MSIPYAPVASTLAYGRVMAASAAIDARTKQHAPLLAIDTTYRTTLRSSFISLPRPMTPTAVAVIDESIEFETLPATATLALDVRGVRMAVDMRTLGARDRTQQIANSVPYRWYSDRLWEFTDYYGGHYGDGYSTAVWVDGVMGWGRRIPVHGTGYPESINADDESIAYTGTDAPSAGTVLQWERELMAVSAVGGAGGAFTLELDRGLDGTEIVAHKASTTLFRLSVPPNLREATILVAKRIGHLDDQPGAGPAWSTEGDTSVNLFRNVDPLIMEFVRPLEA